MTLTLSGRDATELINSRFPGAATECGDQSVLVKGEYLLEAARYLKDNSDMPFNYLTDLTAADFHDYFEVVYRLTSIDTNRSLVLKVRCYDRVNPVLPSVTPIWKGADFMEREILDLMGIKFTGHPNPTRIFLWEGFNGHPLRKDYL